MYNSQGKKQPLLSYLAYSRQKKIPHVTVYQSVCYGLYDAKLRGFTLSKKHKVLHLQVLLFLLSASMEYCTLSEKLFAGYFIHVTRQRFHLISQESWTLTAQSRMDTLYIIVISWMLLSEFNLSCINLHQLLASCRQSVVAEHLCL